MIIDKLSIINSAKDVLAANNAGGYTKPSLQLYPHQWNWDSAVIALGLSTYDIPAAQSEIRYLLKGQWKDGMIPQIVFHKEDPGYFPGPEFWQTRSSPIAPLVSTSGITQPPLLASILLKMHRRNPMYDFVREIYPSLFKWHRWMHVDRDADESGLTCLVHPWESGTDDAPRWLSVMHDIHPVNLPFYERQDDLRVDPDQRPNQEDYDCYVYLVDIVRRHKYNSRELLANSPFLVQDVMFNSILYSADGALRELAVELGEPTGEIDRWMEKVKCNFQNRFWDEERGLFYDYDVRNQRRIRINGAFTFMPFYANLCSKSQAERLINENWENPEKYKPGKGINYRSTTLSRSEPAWEAQRYWRGPIWIILNWLLMQGLENYGYKTLAEEVKNDSIELIAKSGFREYFDPCTGEGYGTTSFSWPAHWH